MKIRNILYISAIMLLAGCSKDADISNSTTLSGNGEKTPLLINATLDTGKGQTRAVGGSFETNDVIKAYVRHMVDDGSGSNYSTLTPTTDYANKTVTITKTNSGFSTDSYWDDFSNSASDETNIRTTTPYKHGLQAYYGYCYNGRSNSEEPAPALTESTGDLTWSVLEDQSTETKYKHSDLLKAPQTATVNYSHSSGQSEDHGTLQLAFTHAMSQITVTVNAGTGFTTSQKPLKSTVITLKNMFTKTQITGPNGYWADVEGDDNVNHKDITMYAKPCDEGSLAREFVAVVAPGTKLRVGNQLMNIQDVHGNYYNVEITNEMIAVAKWATVAGDILNDGANYIETKPGYNYNLTVTVMKSSIQASATLAPWNDVNSTGTGAIQFAADVTGTTSSSGFNDASAFSLYWVKHDGDHDIPAERTNTSYSYATTSTYNSSTGKWTNDPSLYWPNKNDSYYFRALATYSSGSIEVASPSITTTARGNGDNKQTDGITKEGYILWGTTSGGTAISPRTGDVPLEFRVVNKSNVKFTLKTATDDAEMTLSEATISISSIYSTGNIILEDGFVEGTGDPTALNPELTNAGSGKYASASIPVLAQKISDDAVVTITFTKDEQVYSTYKIPLKNCVIADSDTPITVWEGGHTYNYTIHVEKEAVKFSAAVKSWDTVSGSGTATMVNE